MIIAAFDYEATGTDTTKDRITEVGLALYSTGRERVIECTSFYVDREGVPISAEATQKTGITDDLVDAFGYPQQEAAETVGQYFERADAVMGHNITFFDLPMYWNAAKRTSVAIVEKLAIDTMIDIPGVKGEALIKMCADAKDPKTGRDVSFTYTKHSALDDAKAVIRLTSWHDYEQIVERARSPWIVMRSHQPNSKDTNKVVKKLGFRWNPDFKIWWKATKEIDVPTLRSQVPFDTSIADKEEYPLEVLRNS